METIEYRSFPIPVTRTELDGGPTIITIERPSARAELRIVFGSGASSDVLAGTAHMLEHICITNYQQRELREVMLAGYSTNGYTSRAMTEYSVTGPVQRLELLFGALAVCVSRPFFDKRLFQRELAIILHEIRGEYHDVQQQQWLQSMLYPKHSELHASELGRAVDVRRIRMKHLKAYHETQYVRRNMLVIACGSISHQRLVEAVQQSPCMSLPEGVRREQSYVRFTPTNDIFVKSWISSPSVYLYLPMPIRERERYIAHIAAGILNTDDCGMLYNRLRLSEGKMYSSTQENSAFPESWTSIGVNASKRVLPSLEQALREEVAKLVAGEFPQDAWSRVMGEWQYFFDTIVEGGKGWFIDYFIRRWQTHDLEDRWFKDIILNASQKDVHKLISKIWQPHRIARFRFVS